MGSCFSKQNEKDGSCPRKSNSSWRFGRYRRKRGRHMEMTRSMTTATNSIDDIVSAPLSPMPQRWANRSEMAIVSSSFQLHTPTESVRYIEVEAQFHRESSELKREIKSNSDQVIDQDHDSESDFDLTFVTMLSDFEFTRESIDIKDCESNNGLIQDQESNSDQVIDHEAESDNDSESDFDLTFVTMLSDFEFTRESIDLQDCECDNGSIQDHESNSDQAIDHDSESDFDLTFVTMLSDFEFTHESIDLQDCESDNGLIADRESKTEQHSVSNLDSDSSVPSVMPIVQQNTSNDAWSPEYFSKYTWKFNFYDLAQTSKPGESKIDEIVSNQETDFVPDSCSEFATEQTENAPEMLPNVPTNSPLTGEAVFDTTVGLEHDLKSKSGLIHDSECEADLAMVSESSTVSDLWRKIDQNSKSDADSELDSKIDHESAEPDRESLSELEPPRNESKTSEESEDQKPNKVQMQIQHANQPVDWSSIEHAYESGKVNMTHHQEKDTSAHKLLLL